MNAATLINQTSGDVEYYTCPKILEAARRVMGGIELDPASTYAANDNVKAERIFTMADDGLKQDWIAKSIWLNWPFGRVQNPLWSAKMASEWNKLHFGQGCILTYACTSERWFQPLLLHLQCFISPRLNYYLPDGTIKKGVTKGSVVTYLGPNETAFRQHFKAFGVVK